MVYTITFNPALDYIMTVPSCAAGEVNRSETEKILAGGKGINVSLVLNNLGVENTALGFIAGFTGDEIKSILEKAGCKTDFIQLSAGFSRINVKIKSDTETEINS
ncbi:MAG: PfkB family carbohydrate kinase, partial [Firmicutes bacterium]|nr:PfkB family carbohydrate kinase [Bacillota bacterium]